MTNNLKQKNPDSMGPCGVYCGACPSFQVSCNGCGSEDRNQKRTSKWGCKIRKCCIEEKKLESCYKCNEFPCKSKLLKLSKSHLDDRKFKYRHELLDNLKRIEKLGTQSWLKEQKAKWQCPKCPGTIKFYLYKCSSCGLKKYL